METIAISGAFLHADSDGHIIVVLKLNISLSMCRVDQKLYRKEIIFDKRGKPVIYVKTLKALYGLLQRTLLFYRKSVKDLQKYGLEMNPYKPCVFNTINNGNQLTVTLHVDDLGVSHMYPFKITLFA